MILFKLVVNLLLVLRAPLVLLRRRRALPKSGLVRLQIDGRLVEAALKRPRFVLPWMARRPVTSLERVRELCRLIAADSRATGLVVDLARVQAGFAGALELRDAFALVTAAGKRVHVHLPKGGGLKEYFVASVAQSMSMPPHATLFLVGMGGKGFYLKDALEKAGVEPEVEQRYEYKSAGEMFGRSEMSGPAREQATIVLGALADRVLESAAKGRAEKHADGAALLHRGPYRAEDAQKLGLIDFVAHDDELAEALGKAGIAHTKRPDDTLAAARAPLYLARKTARVFLPFRRKRRVAVLVLKGTIVDEGAQPGQIVTKPVVQACEALAKDPSIGAVVLAIDSRGGSASASADMHHAIRTLAAKKPVVAYLSDYAASGGYYIACGADHIVANPLSVTGSIGVIAMRPILERLLGKLGVHRDGVKIGDHAGILDGIARFTEAEKHAMERLIDATYAEFAGVVMQSRKLAPEVLDRLARGRVWLGENAAFAPLRDALGGLEAAIAEAKKRAPVKLADEPLVFEPHRPRPSLQMLPFSGAFSGSPWRDLGFPLLGSPGGAWFYEAFAIE
ncbi:MAG: signal peptide peptidase SppA [Deltaproteobacteria bacterium]|nr:signal peptide peptidase SppA [Deltaproteobacteria bacterium]